MKRRSGGRLAAVVLMLTALVSAQLLTGSVPATAVPGRHVASGEAQWSGLDGSKFGYVYCNGNERVIGGGARVMNGKGAVLLTHLIPYNSVTSAPSSFYGRAEEAAAGHDGTWRLLLYAICVPTSSVPGLQVVGAADQGDKPYAPSKQAVAHCPRGKQVIGTGATVNSAAGSVSFQQIRPNTDGRFVVVEGRKDAYNGQLTPNYRVGAIAVCANPVAGREVVSSLTATSSADKFSYAVCPAGKAVHGVGFTKAGVHSGAYVDTLVPNAADPSGTLVWARSSSKTTWKEWNIAAWAVCAN